MRKAANVNSPLGELQIETAGDGEIRKLTICASESSNSLDGEDLTDAALQSAEEQLNSYFQGRLLLFDLPIDFSDYSPFAVKVLQALQTVPFGTTVSYGELAALVGRPKAARAIGRVVGANRTPILIPCHRVVGSTGALVGYSATGGLVTKRWLLEFEQQTIKKD
jgi:methylated-DNA-[protein]-cysteine S-methyltransferase